VDYGKLATPLYGYWRGIGEIRMSKKANKSTSRRTPWMQEHLDDPFVKKAYADGWRSRAVFKLMEIDKKDRLIRPGMRIIDLGAAPGGWSQYATRQLSGRGEIFALDILDMDSLPDVRFIQGDFTEQAVLDQLLADLGDAKSDLVLSDMAPNLSGMKAVDQPKSIYLAELAMTLAAQVLGENGAFLVKVFQGEGFDGFLADMRAQFRQVLTRKPEASRARSREIYLLGKGIRES